MPCLFCNIIAGSEPAVVLHRDAVCTVILDVYPVAQGHALVLPNRHVALASALTPAEFEHVSTVWYRLLQAYRAAGLAREGANLLLNDGAAANQHIPHVHFHLIPRRRGDTAKTILVFASRVLNIFGRRKRMEALRDLAARLAPELARHLPSPPHGAAGASH